MGAKCYPLWLCDRRTGNRLCEDRRQSDIHTILAPSVDADTRNRVSQARAGASGSASSVVFVDGVDSRPTCGTERYDPISRLILYSTCIVFPLPDVKTQETSNSGKFGIDSAPSPDSPHYPSCPASHLHAFPYTVARVHNFITAVTGRQRPDD
ncbi:hypothetical protein BV22DRAFT_717721 [Leucogyrophana mollusca]|uniref:Uncharacterized protein n=1 Tax=Leucogyrophana mollusca TaxID=85980 RepID=A0ACB8B9M8_9AGAM|nr:hypothetical protein BV22DRAFT_717721 [Leucogyrophana mollusca]